jgi:hypothetical protein
MVRLGVALAVAAVLVAIGVFFIPGPFTEDASWRASVGGTLTTALALMLGAIALIITARVESSDYKAEQETKVDIARLLATLASIQNKGALWRTKQIASPDLSLEAEAVSQFARSTTGFALYNLAAKKAADQEIHPNNGGYFFCTLQRLAVIRKIQN